MPARQWCSGSDQPMCGCGDRCLDCGRVLMNDMTPVVDPATGIARKHLPESTKTRRRRGLVPDTGTVMPIADDRYAGLG